MVETIVSPLGDSLRALAAKLDAVPALPAAMAYPHVPQQITIFVNTREVLEVLAKDFGIATRRSLHPDKDQIHTDFLVPSGLFELRVVAITPLPKTLHRPTDVTEQFEAAQR